MTGPRTRVDHGAMDGLRSSLQTAGSEFDAGAPLLEEQDRVTIETEMSRPLEERIEQQRALNRLPDIMEGLDPLTWTPVVER